MRRPSGIVVTAVLVLAVAATAHASPPSVSTKQAQARTVLAEIRQLDAKLDLAVEAFDAANVKLDRIRGELRLNRREQRIALRNLQIAERRLAQRLRDLYVSGEGSSPLEVLVGASTLDEVITRLDTANRVADEDARILRQVKHFRRVVAREGMQLRRARDAQRSLVAERTAAKARIERGLADRRRLLASIKGEIQRLQAEDAARQAVLAAQVRARLQRQQQAQQARVEASVVGPTAQAPFSSTNLDPITTVAPPSRYGGVVGVAMAQLGKPYVYGTAGPDTFDCSGLVVYAYAALGVSLPHSTYAMWSLGVYVSRDQLEPGDLVFFHGLGHMGIYIGNGQFVQAPRTGDVVKISGLDEGWYASTYVGARRIP